MDGSRTAKILNKNMGHLSTCENFLIGRYIVINTKLKKAPLNFCYILGETMQRRILRGY